MYSRKYCHVSGLASLIIMGSESDDWVYWHFLTITVLMNEVCLTNHSEESLTTLGLLRIHESTPFYKWHAP
jgi:hypothetical protein